MGNYKSTHKNVDNTKLQRIYPEPDYEVKTRPPVNVGNTWRENILLRIREEELSDEAMPLARRKCYDPVMDFGACQTKQGPFWYVFNCQQHFFYVAECFEHQFYVQMDKRRRDMKRNPEPWWQQLYNESGQIGRQAEQPKVELGIIDSLKLELFGIDKFKV